VYMQHGSSVWRQETVCGAFAMGMITLLCKCYSAYYFTNVLSVLAVILLGITYLAYTIQFMLFISYIYSNYTKYSKKLSHSDYICCVHMFGQELYSLFFFVSSLTKDGLRWQDASAFHLYSHVYVLVFLNGFVSIFYDRLAQRDLSWTQASINYIVRKVNELNCHKYNLCPCRGHWRSNVLSSVTFPMKCALRLILPAWVSS